MFGQFTRSQAPPALHWKPQDVAAAVPTEVLVHALAAGAATLAIPRMANAASRTAANRLRNAVPERPFDAGAAAVGR